MVRQVADKGGLPCWLLGERMISPHLEKTNKLHNVMKRIMVGRIFFLKENGLRVTVVQHTRTESMAIL